MPEAVITLYTRKGCHLCEQAKQDLMEFKNEYQFTLEEVDIDHKDELTEQYGLMIPVIAVNGKVTSFGGINKLAISNRLQESTKS